MTTDLSNKIAELRKKLGDDLVIMGHHYQLDDVIRHVDLLGDSLELSRKVPQVDAGHIVFCGVYFMAESAALLARDGQNIYIPAPDADCVMSEMAPAGLAENVIERIMATGRKVIPLTYVNSSAAVKSVVGKFGGTVCTSANAPKMLDWCRSQGDAVLFLPDQNLGQNTANLLGIPEDRRTVLNIRGGGSIFDVAETEKYELLLWPGCCAIHAKFRVEQVEAARREHPDAIVVVHPESHQDVVKASDSAGSTTHIIKVCREAPEGSVIYVGTEIHLVERLAAQYEGRKTIIPLKASGCSNMAKVTEEKLAAQLERISRDGAAEDVVTVNSEIAENARIALERMLEVCK